MLNKFLIFVDTRLLLNAIAYCKIGRSNKTQFGQQSWQINPLDFTQLGTKLPLES